MVTKDEFQEWLHHPVTKVLKNYLEDQIEAAKETLSQEAGMNPLADQNLVGGISACREVLDWKPEYLEDNETRH